MTNNAFANNPYADMFKQSADMFKNNDMFKQSADMFKNNPLLKGDLFKNADAFKGMFKTNFDMNQPLNVIRRNAEAVTEACQVVAEGAQESFRAGTESLRSNVETVLKNSKSVFSSNSPEAGLAKSADLARSIYESTLANVREMTEMATKCSFEAFEVLSARASESVSELSETTAHPVKKKK
jgi:phasin family protein